MKSGHIVIGIVLALVALTIVEALFAPHHHPAFPWHHWPGFQVLIGFGACVVMVKVGKALARWFLQRPEDVNA
jgi:hypothetical protein